MRRTKTAKNGFFILINIHGRRKTHGFKAHQIRLKFLAPILFRVGNYRHYCLQNNPLFDSLFGKNFWYIGTVGFILYFWRRARIESKRANLVKDYDLVNVIEKSDIQGEEKTTVAYLIKTSLTSKARFNSAFIVIVSTLALVASIAVDIHVHF